MVTLACLTLIASGNLTFPDGGLPLSRPFGYAEVGETRVIGGISGLFVGKPGSWVQASRHSVKQIEAKDGSAWVRMGNGAVDRLDIAANRHYHDVLFGSSRRPWVSVIGIAGKTVLFGGHGGWMETSGGEHTDSYPPELKGQVVTAIQGLGQMRWIGTQKSGLWEFGAKTKRFGLAAGLDDPWITGLAHDGAKLWIGTASDGLYTLTGQKITKEPCPFDRVRSLALFNGRPLVATDLGTFLSVGKTWRQLSRVESYGALPGKRIVILQPDEILYSPG